MDVRRRTRWSSATLLPGRACTDWGPGEDPDDCAVEVLFVAEMGVSYVVSAVGPSATAAVATAEDEARRHIGCEAATDWRAAWSMGAGECGSRFSPRPCGGPAPDRNGSGYPLRGSPRGRAKDLAGPGRSASWCWIAKRRRVAAAPRSIPEASPGASASRPPKTRTPSAPPGRPPASRTPAANLAV